MSLTILIQSVHLHRLEVSTVDFEMSKQLSFWDFEISVFEKIDAIDLLKIQSWTNCLFGRIGNLGVR